MNNAVIQPLVRCGASEELETPRFLPLPSVRTERHRNKLGEELRGLLKPKISSRGEMEGVRREESELVFRPPVRQNSIRVRRISMLAPSAAAFTELPTRIKEENAEM